MSKRRGGFDGVLIENRNYEWLVENAQGAEDGISARRELWDLFAAMNAWGRQELAYAEEMELDRE